MYCESVPTTGDPGRGPMKCLESRIFGNSLHPKGHGVGKLPSGNFFRSDFVILTDRSRVADE
jgi:hypothetical protein